MIQETLPLRKMQLYNMYGPGGTQPLIPAAQTSFSVVVGNSGGTGAEQYLELLNPQVTVKVGSSLFASMCFRYSML